jgi:hypothetical protein
VLNDEEKQTVMDTLSAPTFDWSTSAVLALPPLFINKLKLDKRKNLALFFTYISAMKEAVSLGVATVDDLIPNFTRIQNPILEAFAARRREEAPSSTDIGASKSADLESFSLSRLPNESNEHFFSRLCLTRCRGATDGLAVVLPRGLDLEVTDLALKLISPTANDLRVGQLLKEANTHVGLKVGERRLNYLGEVAGMCRQANTKDRVDKIALACQVSSTLEDLSSSRKEVASRKKRIKSMATAAVGERRRDAEKKMEIKTAKLNSLVRLVGVNPANATKFTAVELKSYIATNLDDVYPNVDKKKTLPIIIPYLLMVAELHLDKEGDLMNLEDAAEAAREEIEVSAPPPKSARKRARSSKQKRRPSSAAGRGQGMSRAQTRARGGRGRAGGGPSSNQKNAKRGKGDADDSIEMDGEDENNEIGGEGDASEQEAGEGDLDSGSETEHVEDESRRDVQSGDESDGDDQELSSGEKQYVVASIKDHRQVSVKIRNSKKKVMQLEYLVSWEDCDTDEDSWEPATGVKADKAIAIYNDSIGLDDPYSDDSDDDLPLSSLLVRR